MSSGVPDPTTPQIEVFAREIFAVQRGVIDHTSRRGAQTDMVCEILLDNPWVLELVLRAAIAAVGEHATLRRIRQEGYDEGFEDGQRAGFELASTNTSEEDTS